MYNNNKITQALVSLLITFSQTKRFCERKWYDLWTSQGNGTRPVFGSYVVVSYNYKAVRHILKSEYNMPCVEYQYQPPLPIYFWTKAEKPTFCVHNCGTLLSIEKLVKYFFSKKLRLSTIKCVIWHTYKFKLFFTKRPLKLKSLIHPSKSAWFQTYRIDPGTCESMLSQLKEVSLIGWIQSLSLIGWIQFCFSPSWGKKPIIHRKVCYKIFTRVLMNQVWQKVAIYDMEMFWLFISEMEKENESIKVCR